MHMRPSSWSSTGPGIESKTQAPGATSLHRLHVILDLDRLRGVGIGCRMQFEIELESRSDGHQHEQCMSRSDGQLVDRTSCGPFGLDVRLISLISICWHHLKLLGLHVKGRRVMRTSVVLRAFGAWLVRSSCGPHAISRSVGLNLENMWLQSPQI